MIELTDADRAEIARLSPVFDILEADTIAIYRAGIAAGIERSAQVAMTVPDTFGTLADDSHKECAIVTARLIRGLLKCNGEVVLDAALAELEKQT